MIPIYQSEYAVAGLADKIAAQTSIAYEIPLLIDSTIVDDLVGRAIANLHITFGSERDADLYGTKSILVTTDLNKNDDFFDKFEVWAARHTPSHKPTNIEHDEHKLVGHITDTWAIDLSGNILPDNTSAADLPDVYHIVNGAVIYTQWQDQELIDRTENLIAEIKRGEKFVSMECLFTNFDYVKYTSGNVKEIISRTEASAYLTKHLRAYGGNGVYDGCKLGRVLRNITFSGKGYVSKPANPNSIIFLNALSKIVEKNDTMDNNGVELTTQVETPCDNNVNKQEMSMSKELEAQVQELTQQIAQVNESTQASVTKYEAEIKSLSEKLQASEDSANAQITVLNSKIETLEADLVKANAEKLALSEELDKVKATELKTKRVSALVDGGIEKSAAEQKVEIFANLNDEQFDVLAKELIAAVQKTESKCGSDKEESEEDDEAEAGATEEVLEKAEEKTEAQLSVAADSMDETKALEEVRKQLRDAIASLIGRKVKE